MGKFLVTGVSSGIGRALAKKLVIEGNVVWGVARRENLLKELKKELKNSSKFSYFVMDVSKSESWKKLVGQIEKDGFIPDAIIFNAAIMGNDLASDLDLESTKKMFAVNFFGTLEGVKDLLRILKPGTQFIAISSSSALKGSSLEGIGYPASKAALSIAFESLHQKFKSKYSFKTIYFGPVNSGRGPYKNDSLTILSEERAVKKILCALKGKQVIYCYPKLLFFILKVIKLLPSSIYFNILTMIENYHKKKAQNTVQTKN